MASPFSRLTVVPLLTLILGACAVSPSPLPSSSTTASPSSALSPALVKDITNGISFERPASWLRWEPNAHNPINDGPLAYLSTDPLLPPFEPTL